MKRMDGQSNSSSSMSAFMRSINSESRTSPAAGSGAMRNSARWKSLRSYNSINFSFRTCYGSSAGEVRMS